MSADVLINVSSALATTFAPQLTRIWNRQAILAKTLPLVVGRGQGGGKQVAWDVEYSGATAASFAEGSDVGSGEFSVDPFTTATLAWGQYRSAFQLSTLEINAAAANVANATALEDLIGERFIGALSKIMSVINGDLFAGTGTDGSGNPTIIGLDAALKTSGSYAGINVGTVTEFQSNITANGGTARSLTMNLLAATEQSIFTNSGLEPDLLVGTPGVHTKYEGLFESIRRTVDDGMGPIRSYQGSTNNLFWRGKPLMRDRNATTGKIYMLNSNEIEFVMLPFTSVPDGVMTRTEAGPSSNGFDFESTGVPLHVYPLARTGSAIKFVVEVYCQLKVKRPNAHGIVADISET